MPTVRRLSLIAITSAGISTSCAANTSESVLLKRGLKARSADKQTTSQLDRQLDALRYGEDGPDKSDLKKPKPILEDSFLMESKPKLDKLKPEKLR